MEPFRISRILCINLVLVLISAIKGNIVYDKIGGGNSSELVSGNSDETLSSSVAATTTTRVAKDFLKSFNLTTSAEQITPNSTNFHFKRSPLPLSSNAKVQIIEAGARSRGEPRILKKGLGINTFPRFSGPNKLFTNRLNLNNLNDRPGTRNNGGNGGGGESYDVQGPPSTSSLTSSSLLDNLGNFQVISIPGSNIPPPVYTYTGGISPPAPPPQSSIITVGSPGTLSNSFGSGSGWKPGGGGIGGGTATPRPEIILPPGTPPPRPTGPTQPGTSVPIIGASGGFVRPPAPPPDEIFPPAPPPDSDEDFFGDDFLSGRRLKVSSVRGGNGGSGSSGVNLRTRTRVIPTGTRTTSNSRFSKDSLGSISSHERLRTVSGGTVRRERLRDRVKEFKNSLIEDVDSPLSDEIIGEDPNNIITDFVFSDIKCFKTRQNEYFGATIHMKSGFHLPYIRDRPQDPLRSEECRLEQLEGSRGSYHMAVTDLRGCGVEQCGEAMCLTMVFPRVPILALADDEVTTIKCIPQKSTISDTKSISFAGDSTENRRSSSTVEGGIQEFVAEVGVFRQNPGATNGLFVKRVNSGGVVQLGEPLQLRSVVRGTDGWKHSKLTDVKVWRMRDNFKQNLENLDPNQASEVITLVDAHGCRNDEYLVIAEEHPIRDPRNDMVHHFTFKAFLFRGQRVNEPLIVTARVHACQELQDCYMKCDSTQKRYRRSPIELHNASSIVHDFDSQLALRVVGLKDHPSSILDDDQFPFNYPFTPLKSTNNKTTDSGSMSCNEKMFASGLSGGCIMLLICGLALALFTYIKQGKIQRNRKSTSSSAVAAAAPPHSRGGGRGYRYPPPPGRMMPSSGGGQLPYHKPLPPTPVEPSRPPTAPASNSPNPSNEISQVAKLLQELAKNSGNNDKQTEKKMSSSPTKKSTTKKECSSSSKKNDQASSDYASIDGSSTSSPASSSASSEIDLSKANKTNKDGVYILYCYNKDKKNKLKLPLSAPSSTRMRRKKMKGKGMGKDEEDDDEDFISHDEDSEEVRASQDATESDDSYDDREKNGKGGNVGGNNNGGILVKNQPIRRTVREVKKKSKQNNSIAHSSGGIVRRRVSSVYREGYLSGLRGAVAAAVAGGSVPLRYRKSPSTGNLPEAVGGDGGEDEEIYGNNVSAKRINFSVRERRSARKRRGQTSHHHHNNYEQYSSNEGGGVLPSDLDSAYSGSNCSKLTEDHLYELKRGGVGNGGGHPYFRHSYKQQRNLEEVQRQLRRSVHYSQKGGTRESSGSKINDNKIDTNFNRTEVAIGMESPPLPLGETKSTHFVTHDDSSTKILIVPETHV